MSEITVIGNVAKPELRFTGQGKPVFGFSLAQGHRKKDQQGNWSDDGTTWRKVTVWDQKGELLAEHISQGDRVIVTGQERMKEFDKQDGSKGQSLELTAREVGIVPKAPKQDGGNNYNQQPAQSFPAPTGFNQPPQQQNDPWATPGGNSGQVEAPF